MTAGTIAVPGRSRGRASGALIIGAVAVAAIVAGFASGVLPANRWQPFLQVSTWTFLGEGLLVTLRVGAVALVGSLLLGVPFGMARAAVRGPIGWLLRLWVELVRATPILAILIVIFLGLPRLGIRLPAIEAGIVGLTIYNSAVLGEIVRAGIGSIPRGEVEAARSLGFGYLGTMRLIVLPQALSRMAPAIVSQLITLVKDTSLLFVLGAQELVGYGRSFFTFYSNLLETYIVLACIYFVICYSLSRISRRLELRQPSAERIVVTGEADQLISAVGATAAVAAAAPRAGSLSPDATP
jgi:His/Glu/Gln/Arg/opine family amino acid ABC transporter permease subunit